MRWWRIWRREAGRPRRLRNRHEFRRACGFGRAEAFALAERILRHSSLAAARIITAVTRGLNGSISEGLEIEREQFARMCATHDVREGLDARIARRQPVCSGA